MRMNECEACHQDMTGSPITDKWEDGDNPEAYVTCRHCGHKNIQLGWGGD